MNWIAIVNRGSGGGRSPGRLQAVLDKVRRVASHVVFTEHKGHARQLAAEAGAFEGVVVVGGDGTLLEVINGLEGRKPRLAIVSTGRGNSLARDLGVYPPALGFDAIASGRWCAVDVMEGIFDDSRGRRSRSLAASTIAVGYPAAVVRAAGTGWKRLAGYCYAAATISVRPAVEEMRISAGSREPVAMRLTGFIANNTRHLANFKALPRASCRDGRFDVMEMRAGFIRQSAHNISILSGLQIYNPVTVTAMTRVSLEMNRPQELTLDGELFADVVSVRIEMHRSALEFACGERVL